MKLINGTRYPSPSYLWLNLSLKFQMYGGLFIFLHCTIQIWFNCDHFLFAYFLNLFYIHLALFLLLRYSSKGHLTISQSSVAVWITFHDTSIGFKKTKYRHSYLTNASFNTLTLLYTYLKFVMFSILKIFMCSMYSTKSFFDIISLTYKTSLKYSVQQKIPLL